MDKKYGLKFDTFSEKDYFLGGGFLGTTEINPNGDWTLFCPLPEYQNLNGIDTQGCVREGTENGLEVLFSFVLHEDKNFSGRFLCIVDKSGRNGASPQTVIETIRKIGLVDEVDLPFSDDINTLDKYYSPDPMTSSLLKKAKEFLKQYEIGHEWVYPIGTNQTIEQQNSLITSALKRSPVGASVSAWHEDGKGGFDQAWTENHWVIFVKDLGEYWSVYDSYDKVFKKYSKQSKITMAKIYTVKKLVVEDSATIFTKFWNWLFNFISKQTTETTVKIVEPINIETKEPIKKSDITIGLFCLKIQSYEGYYEGSRSFRNLNPGNLKFRQGMLLAIGQDSAGFAKFATYKDGFMALTNKIRNACEGKSTVYFPDDTILQFFQKYAPAFDNNRPDRYAKYVADGLGVDTSFKIKYLL
jgi:hypothetical protein